MLERLAGSLLRVDRPARAAPDRRAVFDLCRAEGRPLRASCLENVELNYDASQARGADPFEACRIDFFARLDAAAEGQRRGDGRPLTRAAPGWMHARAVSPPDRAGTGCRVVTR
jgi:hypothetical protein